MELSHLAAHHVQFPGENGKKENPMAVKEIVLWFMSVGSELSRVLLSFVG